jgi:hypothetical protein
LLQQNDRSLQKARGAPGATERYQPDRHFCENGDASKKSDGFRGAIASFAPPKSLNSMKLRRLSKDHLI